MALRVHRETLLLEMRELMVPMERMDQRGNLVKMELMVCPGTMDPLDL